MDSLIKPFSSISRDESGAEITFSYDRLTDITVVAIDNGNKQDFGNVVSISVRIKGRVSEEDKEYILPMMRNLSKTIHSNPAPNPPRNG